MRPCQSLATLAIALGLVLACKPSFSAEDLPVPPQVTLTRCERPPLIDGELDDTCWLKAVSVDKFYVHQGGGKTTEAQKVRLACDDTWLYFAFEIELPHPASIRPTTLAHDGSIGADDSVEVFLDPGAGGELYFHYMLNAANVRGERRCLKQGRIKEIKWDLPWRSATKITEKGWQAELATPVMVLAEYGDVSKLTMNVCVTRNLVELNLMGAEVGSTREHTSWSAVRSSFHEPDRFGAVRGMDALNPTPAFLVAAQNLTAGRYVADDKGEFFYEVSGAVRSFTGKRGKALLTIEDKPLAGQGETVRQEVNFTKPEIRPFAMKVPVNALGSRTAEVALKNAATGEALQTVRLRDMAALSLMRVYARYSYYTSEAEADVACEIGLPELNLKRSKLVAKGEHGKTLSEVGKVAPRTMLPVPIKDLGSGSFPVTVELQRRDGQVMIRQEALIVKRKPKPGCEWKMDRADKVILNNGKPFFPFGVMCMTHPSNPQGMVEDVASMGFNSLVRWGRAHPFEQIEDLLETARKHKLYVVEHPGAWRFKPLEDNPRPKPPRGMGWKDIAVFRWDWHMKHVWLPGAQRVMNHSNLMAWYLRDEPQDHRKLAACILRFYRKLYELDGYRPAQVLYIPPIPEGDEFTRNCDILGIDPYWVPGAGGALGNPNRVGICTWQARRRADRDLKLVWVTPCAERWSRTRKRIFDEREQRVQTYLSLIHGAKGLLYFVYPFIHQSTADTFTRLGAEMKVLGPACAAPEVSQNIHYAPIAFDPSNNSFPDVQVGLKRNPRGGYILLAANYRPYPVEVTYRMSLLPDKGRVAHLLDGTRTCAVEKGVFHDRMAAMDTRAYAIAARKKLSVPVEVRVEQKSRPKETDPFYAAPEIPDTAPPGKKNILRNSGFEDCSIPGMPDYYTHYSMRTAKTRQGYRLGDPRGDCGWSLDSENPHEGEHCLRLTGSRALLIFGVHPKLEHPTPFTFSAWVRGEGKNVRVGFFGPNVDREKKYPATSEWRRISQTITVPARLAWGGHLFGFLIASRGAEDTVWIDAMQLEKGTKLTDYEP